MFQLKLTVCFCLLFSSKRNSLALLSRKRKYLSPRLHSSLSNLELHPDLHPLKPLSSLNPPSSRPEAADETHPTFPAEPRPSPDPEVSRPPLPEMRPRRASASRPSPARSPSRPPRTTRTRTPMAASPLATSPRTDRSERRLAASTASPAASTATSTPRARSESSPTSAACLARLARRESSSRSRVETTTSCLTRTPSTPLSDSELPRLSSSPILRSPIPPGPGLRGPSLRLPPELTRLAFAPGHDPRMPFALKLLLPPDLLLRTS